MYNSFKTFINEEAFRKQAIFIFGKSASGKSGLSRTLSSLFHIPIIDSDHFYEPLLFKHNLSMDFSKHNEEQTTKAKELRSLAITQSRDEWKGYAKKGLSFIYTGLGNQMGWVSGIVMRYQELGYHCHIIFMDVSLEEAKKRNKTRERKIPETVLDKQHPNPQQYYIDNYMDLVGENDFLYVKNETSYDVDDIMTTVDRWVE